MTTLGETGTSDRAEGEFVVTRHECEGCGRRFDGESAVADHWWDAHFNRDDVSVLVECVDCGEVFSDLERLDEHWESAHVPAVPRACAACRQPFDSIEDVSEHYWANHVYEAGVLEHEVSCPECDWAGPSEGQLLLDHYYGRHNLAALFGEEYEPEASRCPFCGDVLADEKGMVQHIAAKSEGHDLGVETHYSCTVCDGEFGEAESAAEHVRDEHAPSIDGVTVSRAVCPECGEAGSCEEWVMNHYCRRHLTGRLACPECDVTESLGGEERMQRHVWEAHSEDGEWTVEEAARVDRELTLECLYNINKHAKKYANLGSENYRKGKKTTAKANSLKKEALYAMKERVLEQIYRDAEAVRRHRIDGNEFYLFDFGTYSFHTPVENMRVPEELIEGVETLEDFEADAEKEHSDRSLKDSLLFFEEEFGLNANDYLGRQYLSYGHESYFIGWEYLGDT